MKRLLLFIAIGVAGSLAPLAAQSIAPHLADFEIRAIEEAMRNPDRHVASSRREATVGEQVAAGIGLIFVMAIVVAGALGIAYLCERVKDYFSGKPHVSKEQRDIVNVWRLRQIGLGRATWRTAPLLVPSQDDLRIMTAELKVEIDAAKVAKPAPQPLAETSTQQRASIRRQKGAPIVIEMVADAFKPNMTPPTKGFHEIVTNYCEDLRKLIRLGRFDEVIESFTREEQRTHQSMKCACVVVEAMLDAIKHDVLVGILGCRIKPERGKDGETAYRCKFFIELSAGRRSLQPSDLQPLEEEGIFNITAEEFKAYFEGYERTRAFLLGFRKERCRRL